MLRKLPAHAPKYGRSVGGGAGMVLEQLAGDGESGSGLGLPMGRALRARAAQAPAAAAGEARGAS